VRCGDISCSIGAATYPEDGSSIRVLLESADGALFSAKRAGRNRVMGAGRKTGSRGSRDEKPACGSDKDVLEELLE
jgi:hypothetical protein